MIFYRRGHIRDPGVVEVISCGVHDPFAVLIGGQRIPANRRFRCQRAILVLDEQVKITPTVVQRVERDDCGRSDFLAVRHDPLRQFVSSGNVNDGSGQGRGTAADRPNCRGTNQR